MEKQFNHNIPNQNVKYFYLNFSIAIGWPQALLKFGFVAPEFQADVYYPISFPVLVYAFSRKCWHTASLVLEMNPVGLLSSSNLTALSIQCEMMLMQHHGVGSQNEF